VPAPLPFCYARRTHWFLDQDGVNGWGSRIFVKVNAPEVLRRELSHPSWAREEVQIGTATDPYQPAEAAYKITRQLLEILNEAQTPAALETRSTMVVRDIDVLQQLARGPGMRVCISIATLDATIAREIEPDVPPPARRLEALQAVAQAGIPTAVLLAPVLPGLTDAETQLAEVVHAARAHGASSLWTNALHLGEVTRDAFFEYLETRRPELLPQYAKLYKGKYAPVQYREQIQRIVAEIKRRAGFPVREHAESKAKPPVSSEPVQLRLFAR
jgi:DNA repair photolyase